MEELISVIIPVYKVENYLDRCVSSVREQTYSNIEIILIDDGSPDRCGEMCDDYEVIDTRVRVLHKKNEGLSSARNLGVEIATGKYLTFLDSDDWVHEKYVEKLYCLIREYNADIAISNHIKVRSDEISVTNSVPEVLEFSNMGALCQLFGELSAQFIVSCGKLYKKELFDEIEFPIGKLHEDEYVAHHILHKADKVVYTNEILMFYRQREDSIMGLSSCNAQSRADAIGAFNDRATFFDGLGQADLRDKTYRSIFYLFRQLFEIEDRNEVRNELLEDFFVLRQKLRNGKHSTVFRLKYEMYYSMPKLFAFFRSIYLLPRNIIVFVSTLSPSRAKSQASFGKGDRKLSPPNKNE